MAESRLDESDDDCNVDNTVAPSLILKDTPDTDESASLIFSDKSGYVVELPLSVGTETEISSNSSSCTQIDTRKYKLDNTQNPLLVSTSSNSHLNLNQQPISKALPGFTGSVPLSTNAEADLISNRKHKDMMRKRVLRQSPEYRKQETVRSRNRMKMKRSDPLYREIERQRDRERRRVARMCNPEQRAAERERDRLYKRRARSTVPVSHNHMHVSHEVIVGLPFPDTSMSLTDEAGISSSNDISSGPLTIVNPSDLNVD